MSDLPTLDHCTWQEACDGAAGQTKAKHCGQCDVCRFHVQLRARYYAAPDDPAPPVLGERLYRWGSAEAAIRELVRYREDGAKAPSVSGALKTLGTLGVSVQRDREAPPPEAEDLVHVERAMWAAFDDYNNRGLTTQQCLEILLARVIGKSERKKDRIGRHYFVEVRMAPSALSERYGISAVAVSDLVGSGMKRIRIDLIARGLVAPISGNTEFMREVDARRAKLLK